MANSNVVQITDANFEQEVLKSTTPVLVDFWAEWCMPCRMLAPTIDELANTYAGRVKVGKLDTDANRQSSLNYQINAIPTILVFKDGKLVQKFVGVVSKQDLAGALDKALA